MTKKRGFEIVSSYEGEGIHLPERATERSAGYDLEAAKTVTLPSIWRFLSEGNERESSDDFLKSTLVPTGIKAYMPDDEVLILANRSSNPMKRGLALPNGIGVIDADYYGNEGNEGEIFVQLINYGAEDFTIQKGDRIAQGIFMKYGTVDQESLPKAKREGGFGSSGY